MFILSQSNSIQNLSTLPLKTKELGGWKTAPPQCYTSQKKAGAYRVKQQEQIGPEVAINMKLASLFQQPPISLRNQIQATNPSLKVRIFKKF